MALTRPRSYQLLDSDFKDSVRVATTTNATLTGGAPNTVDGVVLSKGNRILVKDQTLAAENGIYVVQSAGTGSNGTWVRSGDFNETRKVSSGVQIYVEQGLVNGDSIFSLTTNNPIVLGTTELEFRIVAGAGKVNNVYYVSKSGSDSFDGTTLSQSFATIDRALQVVNALPVSTNTTIYVKSGEYTINNPINIPANVALIGDNLRTTFIMPTTTNVDLFYVNNGCYITGFTFKNHVSPAAVVAYNPNGSAGVIFKSPYVQNCSSITTTGTGMRIDGAHVTGLRSMVADAFTQINAGGKGVHIKNRGYAQLVSIFTVCCDTAVLCESGGQCSITNSNSSFGIYGLKSTGSSLLAYSGTVAQDYNENASEILITGLASRPNYGDAIKFSSDSFYYTVVAVTELSGTNVTVTLDIGLKTSVLSGTAVTFHQHSLITASSHTFEYVGSGIDVATAIPQAGGIPIQANEIVQDANGEGQIYFTSTDQQGDFRIGGELVINRATGTITGTTFDRSLFAVLTPYILALES